MALDKLVDSTQLDTDLTSVANAIRTKGGTSAQLAFPAGFVSAIGDIPSGGLPTGVTAVATGTITQASATASLTITHNLGYYPKVFAAFIENVSWKPTYNEKVLYAAAAFSAGTSTLRGNVREHTTNNKSLQYNTNNITSFTENAITIGRMLNTQGQWVATQYTNSDNTETESVTYRWVAFA